jgi:cell division protein FtsW
VSAQAAAAVATTRRQSRDVARAEPDRWLLLFTLLLSGGGLLMVLSASQVLGYLQFRQPFYYFWRQAAGMLMGLAALLVLRRVPYVKLCIFARPAALVAVVLMLLVALPHVGMEVNGARRWFNLGVLGSFQPSEFGKLAFALFLADWLVRHEDRITSFVDGFIPFAMLSSVGLALLMLEKDLGTGLVMAAMFAAMFYAAGGRTAHVLLLLAGLVLAFSLFTLAEPYRLQRLAVFRDPFRDPLATGFQSVQALTALGTGGLTGIGLGHSVQKFLWLPAAHTDFIFAIIGEETGLVGTTGVLLGFFALATRGYRAAMRAPDRLGLTLAAGLTTWIAFQALINMATVTATLPVTGVPLPFISYGGTAVAVTLAAVGVLLNVAGQGSKRPYRRTNATVDFGRRHRRAPVPSPRRRASVSR